MITLAGRPTAENWTAVRRDIWRVCSVDTDPDRPGLACRLPDDWSGHLPTGFGFYLVGPDGPDLDAPTLRLTDRINHIEPDDVISVDPTGQNISVMWKASATHNALLLTEQCDNYCLMCSQPPKQREDAWLYERAERIISALPPGARSLGLTGGEPTLHAEPLLALLRHCRVVAPHLQLHMLSNGRRFAEWDFAVRYAEIQHEDMMVGIPLYAPEPSLHDFVVQAEGAFNETTRGILNLAALQQCVEIRVVVQKHTVPVLPGLADFIARNLPFVDQVVWMGLEMTGLARPNANEVWIDPLDYQGELAEAVHILHAAKVHTMVYNHQLCVLAPELWPFAVQSISDWKNDYEPVCEPCALREECGGVFTTGSRKVSRGLAPFLPDSGSAVPREFNTTGALPK